MARSASGFSTVILAWRSKFRRIKTGRGFIEPGQPLDTRPYDFHPLAKFAVLEAKCKRGNPWLDLGRSGPGAQAKGPTV